MENTRHGNTRDCGLARILRGRQKWRMVAAMSIPLPEINLPITWINGAILETADARVQADDSGFLLGLGVFETLALRDGRTFALSRHLARLRDSARKLEIEPPPDDTIRDAIEAVCAAAGLPDLRLRVSLSAGPLGASPFDTPGPPTLVVTASRLAPTADTAALATVPWRRASHGALAGIKSLSYAENARCLREARRLGADEALVLDEAGRVCECAAANLFWIKHDILYTPHLATGCLPGVTRALVLILANTLGIRTEEVTCKPDALADTDEIFITSSIRGVQAVRLLNGQPQPEAPGPVTRLLVSMLDSLRVRAPDP